MDFSQQIEQHRRELQLHCYRMTGSYEDSEDLVQETFLRAWRRRDSYAGRGTLRAWLYRIATNVCLDALARKNRAESPEEVLWIEPYPDELIDGVVAKETVELAFMVAIQKLPPRPRAVLILRDVLGWPAKDVAQLLDTTVASVNSALQRAHAGLKESLPERRTEWAPGADPTRAERELLQRYVEATEQADGEALVELMRDDSRFSMPPEPGVWVGRDNILAAWKEGGFGTEEFGDFRCLETRVNRQPAIACYLRRPGEPDHRPLGIDVLRIEEGRIGEIMTFPPPIFAALGLPPRL